MFENVLVFIVRLGNFDQLLVFVQVLEPERGIPAKDVVLRWHQGSRLVRQLEVVVKREATFLEVLGVPPACRINQSLGCDEHLGLLVMVLDGVDDSEGHDAAEERREPTVAPTVTLKHAATIREHAKQHILYDALELLKLTYCGS